MIDWKFFWTCCAAWLCCKATYDMVKWCVKKLKKKPKESIDGFVEGTTFFKRKGM